MAKQKEPNYRITAYWNDDYAEYVYVLERDAGSSFKQPEDVAEGDREWANRQAEHYGIELPKSLQEEKPKTIQPNEPPYPAKPLTPLTPTNPPIAMSTPTFPTTPGVTN